LYASSCNASTTLSLIVFFDSVFFAISILLLFLI